MDDTKLKLSEDFAIKIVFCCRFLQEKQNEKLMSKQLLRSGTSIGANIAESVFAESKEDFIHKLRISLKEASETKYWLNLLHKTEYLPTVYFNDLNNDCLSLIKLLTKIINSTQANTLF